MKMWYKANAQSQYLRTRCSPRPHRRGLSKSEGCPTAPGAIGIELGEIPTMGLFYLRRQGALAGCRSGENPIHREIEIQALTHRLSTWSSMRANEYLEHRSLVGIRRGKEAVLCLSLQNKGEAQ